MQQNTARMVTLADSSGKKYTAQSTTAYNQVYTIENPQQGKWLLSFPVYTGAHSFIAKAYGNKNVDFVTYFMHQERPDGPVLTIANPLKGNELLLDKTFTIHQKHTISKKFLNTFMLQETQVWNENGMQLALTIFAFQFFDICYKLYKDVTKSRKSKASIFSFDSFY